MAKAATTKTARRVDFNEVAAAVKKIGPDNVIALAGMRAPKRAAIFADLAMAGAKPGSSRKTAARRTPKKPARAGRGGRPAKDKAPPAAA